MVRTPTARACRGGGDADWGAFGDDDDAVDRRKRRGHGAARASAAIAGGPPFMSSLGVALSRHRRGEVAVVVAADVKKVQSWADEMW